jgi:ATP-dependent RNA helicase DDX5/DBP2
MSYGGGYGGGGRDGGRGYSNGYDTSITGNGAYSNYDYSSQYLSYG